MAPVKMLWGPVTIGAVNATFTTLGGQALNDSDNAVTWVFPIPRDGTVTDVGLYVAAENGTSPAYNCGLVTLDSSGRPTTTAYGGSAVTPAQWTSTGWKWVTLSSSAAAAAGDFAAVYVYPTASAPDGSNNITVTTGLVATGDGFALNYTTGYINGGTGYTIMAIKYDDNFVHGLALTSNSLYLAINSDTTPDEVGCLFQLPASMTCYGARFFAAAPGWGSAATADVVLYDASNNVLANATIGDKDYVDDNSAISVYWDGVNLSASTNYRLTIKPTTGTNGNVYVVKWPFESTSALAAIPCGDTWQWTERADAGAWTNTNTAVCPIGLWVSNIDFSGGTVTSIFTGTPYSAEFPASNYPQLTLSNRRPVLAFDASTDETAYWTFIVPQGGVGTSLTCIITYAMASATSGSVYWQAQLEAITPGDATDTDAATSFDTANSGNGTVPGTAGYVGTVTITMTNADNIAAGDLVRLSVNRDADNASDTATGDAYLLAVELRSA